MPSAPWLVHLVPSLILAAAAVDDLRTRKVHNWLVVTAAVVAVISTLLLSGWPGLQQGLLAAGLALALTLPLVLTGMLGAGDLKLLVAFSLAVQVSVVFWVFIYSIFWAALLGVFQALLQRQGLSLLKNTMNLAVTTKPARENLHMIPYTIALVFGWLTHLSLAGWPGFSL